MVLFLEQQEVPVVLAVALEVGVLAGRVHLGKVMLAVQILTQQEVAAAVAVLVLLVRLQLQVQVVQVAQEHLTPFLVLP